MKLGAVVLGLVLALAAASFAVAVAAVAAPPGVHTVSCRDVIDRVASGRVGDYRVALGVVAVPGARMPQVVRGPDRDWPYWRKAGLVVRGGSPPVTVGVPKAWRGRVAISWGDNDGVAHTVRFPSCPAVGARRWNAFAGGFSLRAASACVPLVIRVGSRQTVFRFGLARPCR